MDLDEEQRFAALIFDSRWGALATSAENVPMASCVAYVADTCTGGVLIHVSRLARHTTNILMNPQVSLVVSEADSGCGDPQTLARVTLQGQVVEIPRDSDDYAGAREQYIKRLPDAQQLFGFADFILFRMSIEQVRYVAGFGKSYTLSQETLQRLRRNAGR